MGINERRTQSRFYYNVDAQVNIHGNPGSRENRWNASYTTQNICAGGAYLLTDRPLIVGTRLDVSFKLSFPEGGNIPRRSTVSVAGTVVRVEQNGMAVRFDNKYQITPMDGGQQG